MSALSKLADAHARDAALDPRGSFIVQAPAGSGKTELLIQRYLRLLSVVAEPEEVLAITFTRKAAGEMRTRLEAALRAAEQGVTPAEPHLALGYRLAREVLEQARQRGWQLLDFPTRLRISTIDAVNAGLARRVPLSAGVTSQNTITDDTDSVYRAAIRETLLLAEEPGERGQSIRTLLAHCDNRAERVEAYLQVMLERRDQWLRHTGSGRDNDPDARRKAFEVSLRVLVETALDAVHAAVPADERKQLVMLLRYAGESIFGEHPDSLLATWRDHQDLPTPRIANLDLWRGMQICFQKQGGEWRKKVNKNDGFPPDGDHAQRRKNDVNEMLARLAEHETFRVALATVASLPDARYTESQWALIDALWQVLPLTVAMLKNTFAERGVTDYAEVAQEAVAALGGNDEASDLRLALDYQIKHILLDEFQDTSRSQFALIERLTEGWETEPDRSLFLVGDPMQSIYRFREAEVGLFLDARRHGIGGLKLDEIILETNFRSTPGLVNWFNDAFKTIFPLQEDAATGAIAFVPSKPAQNNSSDGDIAWHPVPFGRTDFEADLIADLVEQTLARWQATADEAGQEKHQRDIGILVRSRRHAVEIGRSLHRRSIPFTATGLEDLDQQSIVQDLLALTRALMHLGDRIAWLGLLRAPWCGLTLADLHALAADDHDACIWTQMNDTAVLERMSADGRIRLDRCRSILANALERYGSIALRDLVESTWLQLGGPATLGADADSELAIVDQFFDQVGALEADRGDGSDLLRLLAGKPVSRGSHANHVSIMTIHKAKGLEFDTVMLPGLARGTRNSARPPLLFHEFQLDENSPGLIVAPVAGSDQEGDPIHDLLWGFEREREKLEQDRLLYVAVTRARRQLHLFAELNRAGEDDPTPREPADGTLLQRLWPVATGDPETMQVLTGTVELPVKTRKSPGCRDINLQAVPLRRLRADWRPPTAPEPCGTTIVARDQSSVEPVEFEWASAWTKHVGSVVHRWLQQIAIEGVEHWDAQRVEAAEAGLRRALRRVGVGQENLGTAVRRVIDALCGALADSRGRWLLEQHAQAETEYSLTTTGADLVSFHHNIIDRTFVCDEGSRWIIDYKTGIHQGGNVESFLRSEADRYRPQLARYRDAFLNLEDRPVRTALYFPLLQIFHEVECDAL